VVTAGPLVFLTTPFQWLNVSSGWSLIAMPIVAPTVSQWIAGCMIALTQALGIIITDIVAGKRG